MEIGIGKIGRCPYLFFIGRVMGTEGDEFDGFVRAMCAVGAGNYAVIALFAADHAIQVNHEEILFNRAGIISSEITFERLSVGNGIFNDAVDLSLDRLFDGAVYPQRFDKSIGEKDVQ